MKPHQSLIPEDGPTLTRRDLITFEHFLRDEIARFLPFTAYSLYFPRSLDAGDGPMAEVAAGRAAWVPEEKRVLLPLSLNGRLLGVFVAKGATMKAPKTMPPHLARMARLCLEKLLLYKISVTDGMTSLSTRDLLVRAVTREIAQVGDCIRPGSDKCLNTGAPGFSACFGLVTVRLHELERCQEVFGPAFAAEALRMAAETVAESAPEQALAARAGDDALALCLPGATPAACAKLARALASELSGLRVMDPVLEEYVHPAVSVGYATYPQDFNGHALRLSAAEQAAMLLRKATRAAAVSARLGDGRAFGYPHIVEEGGQVAETLALGRLTVDLGSAVGAREGQRFLVWPAGGGADAPVKGEVSLLEVRRATALAEVMYQADPSLPLLPGDRLTRVRESDPAHTEHSGERRDALTGLMLYRDFLEHWAAVRAELSIYTLALMRLPGAEHAGPDRTETALRDLAAACAEVFGPNAVGGRHSLGGLVWLLPGIPGRKATALCERLAARLDRSGAAKPVVGLAPHPFLSFSRADGMDNAAKALEYAELLPEPHIGLADTLALNIHADKLFAQGRLYDAIEEYKLALLADKSNTMARNSLGVALARSGDLTGAKRQFKTVLNNKPKDLFALYNYGYACQRTGKVKEAREAYKKCLAVDPAHAFALIRLGELSQSNRRFADARRYFLRAAETEGGEGLTRRYLARLELAQGDTDAAREHLHQALIHDPMDAVSLHLMAKLYLDGGEDPEVAEALARQSAALAPGQIRFWQELSRALEAQGRHEEAAAVLARAGHDG